MSRVPPTTGLRPATRPVPARLRSPWRSASSALLALASLTFPFALAAGCGEVLGEISEPPVERNTTETDTGRILGDEGDAADAGPAPALGGCEEGDVECAGSALRACTGDGWLILQRCASDALCDSGSTGAAGCGRALCAPGEVRCDGAALEECNADRNGWTLLDGCVTAAHCNTAARRCDIAPCSPGDVQCSQGTLRVCRADQTGWDDRQACETQALCERGLAACNGGDTGCAADALACEPPECDVGAQRCSEQGELQVCNADRTGWDTIETCATAALCDPALSACVPPVCDPGRHRCTPSGALEVCNADQTGFELVEQCIASPFCNSVTGQERCEEAPCESGERRCNGAQIESCRADRTAFDPVGAPCATVSLCIDENPADVHCDLPVCLAGAFQCAGVQLQRCNDGRNGFLNVSQCATPQLCNQGLGRCDVPMCSPGQRRCNGAFVEECNAGRTGFVRAENCGTGQCIPFPVQCSDPCRPGQARCNGARLEQCPSLLDGWQTLATCESAPLCNAGARRCDAPVCAPGQRRCSGQSLETCAPGRNAFTGVRVCPAGQICDAEGNQCDVCVPGRLRCDADDLLRCERDGQGEVLVESCEPGLCTAAANGATGSCLEPPPPPTTPPDPPNVPPPPRGVPACVEQDLGGVTSISVVGSTVGEDEDLAQSCAGGGAVDAVFFYTAPVTGRYQIDTIGSGFDTALSVYSGCGSGSELACNDDIDAAAGLSSSGFVAELVAGESFVIAVSGFFGSVGSYQLNVTLL